MESRKCYIQSLAYSLRFFIDPLTDNDIRLIVKLINTCKVLDEFGYVAVCGQMLPSPDYKNMFIALARIVDENIDQIYLPFIYNENALEYVGSLFKKKGLVLKLDQVIKIVTEDGNKLPEAVSELKRMKFFNYMLEKF